MRPSPRSRRPLLVVLLLAAASLALPAMNVDAAAVPACMPAGIRSNPIIISGTALAHGGYVEQRCQTMAGKNYEFVLNYTLGGNTPYDIGNYVGVQLYRDNGTTLTFLGNSTPNGNGMETLTWTSSGNETWYIKVENLAGNGAYDTGFGLTAVLPGGGEGG